MGAVERETGGREGGSVEKRGGDVRNEKRNDKRNENEPQRNATLGGKRNETQGNETKTKHKGEEASE